MTVPSARRVGGRKFMWDGRVYASANDADAARARYEGEGFETFTCEDQGQFLVYTRRAIAQGAADAP